MRDLMHRPVLGKMEAMNGIDLFAAQLGLRATYNAVRTDPPATGLLRRGRIFPGVDMGCCVGPFWSVVEGGLTLFTQTFAIKVQ
jgi:hypothetical protein